MSKNQSIHPKVSIGHIHLKVSNLERSVKFYTEVLGFEITTRMGNNAAFLSAGGYHHHIGLNTWESRGGRTPALENTTGLYHFAILMPDRCELARMIKRLADHHWPIDGMADHGVSEAVSLKDPDGNGVEIYADRPRDQWPKDDKGNLVLYARPLDIQGLMKSI
jgi:catechol 2,3-dioxygenase